MTDHCVRIRWSEHPHLDQKSSLAEIIEAFAYATRGQVIAALAVVDREMSKGIISAQAEAMEQRFCGILLEEGFVTIRQLAAAAIAKSFLRM